VTSAAGTYRRRLRAARRRFNPRLALQLSLGVLTAIGGFLDVGAIATAGAAGAKFRLGLVWALVLGTLAIILLLLMVGRFTAATGKPYAAAVREHLGFKFYLVPLTAEVITNSLMLAAELGGMAIAMSMLTGANWHLLFPLGAAAVLAMAWFAPFSWIENGPATLGLVTLCFVVAVVAQGGPPSDTWSTLVRPDVRSGDLVDYLFLAAAILGAIISPYLVYFYSSGAREERWTRRSLHLNRVTAVAGMSFGCLVAVGVVMAAAIALAPRHLDGSSFDQISLTLVKPWGRIGGYLFATSLLVTCFGAALEIALTLPFEIAQGFGWSSGKDKPKLKAARFNLAILVVVAVAVAIGATGIDPLQLTLYASAFTALILPFSLFPFLIVMNDRDYLGDQVNGRLTNVLTVGVVALASLVALVTLPLTLLSGGA
jgi:Mn2+/Fe2+ NRAMP family transporter